MFKTKNNQMILHWMVWLAILCKPQNQTWIFHFLWDFFGFFCLFPSMDIFYKLCFLAHYKFDLTLQDARRFHLRHSYYLTRKRIRMPDWKSPGSNFYLFWKKGVIFPFLQVTGNFTYYHDFTKDIKYLAK